MQVDASSDVEPEVAPEFSSMTEDEQISYAMQMSLAADAGTILKTSLKFWPLYIVYSIVHYKLMHSGPPYISGPYAYA